MKLGTKMVGSFLLVALVALVIGLFGYYKIHKLDEADTKLNKQIAIPLGQLVSITSDSLKIRIVARDMIYSEKEGRQKFASEIDELFKSLKNESKNYESTLFSEDGKKLFKEYNESIINYENIVKKLVKLALEDNMVEVLALLKGDARIAGTKVQETVKSLVESKTRQGKLLADSNNALADISGWIMLGLAIVGSILAFVMGVAISRSITVPVNALAADAARLAEGDLTVQIDRVSSDEVGNLAESFRTMAENLRSTIRQVADTSSSVSASANQLHSTAEQIATGAEEVVAQVQTVATAGEEMAATSNDIANNCQNAASGAMDASASASDGGAVVDKTVKAMEQIASRVRETSVTVARLGERSDQIGQIVGTIEDIADQTNLLALNAAIEAARAGEMGRGFAVVADEVRALAERTTKATKEISDMIRTIQSETRAAVTVMEEGVREVEQGTHDAARSGEALQSIMEQVNMVSMQISQVATAAEEQTATTNEISNNMHQITDVIHQTARGAHESATAAARLSGNAEELQRLVNRFRL